MSSTFVYGNGTTTQSKAAALSADALEDARAKELSLCTQAVQKHLLQRGRGGAAGASGFLGVSRGWTQPLVFKAMVWNGVRNEILGYYFTAELAAEAVFWHPNSMTRVIATAGRDLTPEEALAQAETEGLKLQTSTQSLTGYKFVCHTPAEANHPYKAQLSQKYDNKFLGYFVTKEQAALAVAREFKQQELDETAARLKLSLKRTRDEAALAECSDDDDFEDKSK